MLFLVTQAGIMYFSDFWPLTFYDPLLKPDFIQILKDYRKRDSLEKLINLSISLKIDSFETIFIDTRSTTYW